MLSNEPVSIVRRIFEQGVNSRDFATFDELMAPDYVAHSAVLGEVRGVESFKRGFRAFIDPCPDFNATLEDVFVAGDKVTARVTYRGTDTGGMFGRAPSGRVRELWQEADRLGLMQQLGAIPVPGQDAG